MDILCNAVDVIEEHHCSTIESASEAKRGGFTKHAPRYATKTVPVVEHQRSAEATCTCTCTCTWAIERTRARQARTVHAKGPACWIKRYCPRYRCLGLGLNYGSPTLSRKTALPHFLLVRLLPPGQTAPKQAFPRTF